MTQPVPADTRSAIERARFFLAKAKECPIDYQVDFEAYLEASIIFGRSAIHRVKSEHKKEAGFKKWWDSLREDPSVNFFRLQRDMILKEAPPELGQILCMPLVKNLLQAGGEPVEDNDADYIDEQATVYRDLAEQTSYASDLYYFDDDPWIPATETVEGHLNKLEVHINAFLQTLG